MMNALTRMYSKTSLQRGVAGIAFTAAVSVLAQPVAAQSGIEIARNMTCNTRAAPMLTALWIFGIMGLGGYAIYTLINGLRKNASSNPKKVKEGREQATGTLYVIASIVILIAAPRLLTFMGISVFDCLQFTLP